MVIFEDSRQICVRGCFVEHMTYDAGVLKKKENEDDCRNSIFEVSL